MEGRDDALLPAARFVLAVDEVARAHRGAVGTVGRVEVHPGSTNSIPGAVALSLDVRALEVETVEGMLGELRELLRALPRARGIPARVLELPALQRERSVSKFGRGHFAPWSARGMPLKSHHWISIIIGSRYFT